MKLKTVKTFLLTAILMIASTQVSLATNGNDFDDDLYHGNNGAPDYAQMTELDRLRTENNRLRREVQDLRVRLSCATETDHGPEMRHICEILNN